MLEDSLDKTEKAIKPPKSLKLNIDEDKVSDATTTEIITSNTTQTASPIKQVIPDVTAPLAVAA